jgi:hypothetical protein
MDMTASAFALATALSAVGAVQPSQPVQFKPSKPLFAVPPLAPDEKAPRQKPPNPEMPAPGEPLVCTRMPVVPGDNRVDPQFVRETPKEVHYTMRRAPGMVRPCPKPSDGEK